MMRDAPLPVRLLLRLGLSPQKTLLCASDLLALLGTALFVFLVRAAFGDIDPVLYRWVLPFLFLGPILGSSLNLYQGISLPPHRELRALFLMVTLTYSMMLVALFLSKSGDIYSRFVIAGSWGVTLFTLPALRGLCRRRFSWRRWWGLPLIILDRSDAGRELWHYLKRHPERGLTPVDIFSLPDDQETLRLVLEKAAVRWPGALVMILQRPDREQSLDYVTEVNKWFSKILLVPAFGRGFRVHWLTPRDLGNAVGLLLRQNLHDRWRLHLKRGMDILACLFILPVLVPLGLLLALLIRLDSPGPVLYRQRRIGQKGRRLDICKFRTMMVNADAALREILARDPSLRAEWQRDQKLRHDPRITRVGAFLRKTSLDELPQLINVVMGEMSLVGPRPIVESEIAKYGEVYDEYCRVKPGITGLWQISGRNDTSYDERVAYDHYYINNWSVWMDIWILCRTVPVALTGYGAY